MYGFGSTFLRVKSIASAASSKVNCTMSVETGAGESPHWFFAIAASLVGFVFLCLTPPFQAPDEPAHFLRAWQISEGHFIAQEGGGVLPQSLGTCFAHYLSIRYRSEAKITLVLIRQGFSVRLNPGACTFYTFPNTAIYSPVPYTGAAIFMRLGKLFCQRPLVLMYVGRLGNLFLYVVIGFAALWQLPVLKRTAMVILLSPVPMFLAASLSADAFTIALVFLVIAQIARVGCDDAAVPIFRHFLIAVSLIAIQLCKWAYAPVAIFLLSTSSKPWGSGKARAIGILSIYGACALAFCGWTYFSGAAHNQMHGGNPAEQARWIPSHPGQYFLLLVRTLINQTPALAYTSLGAMGWLDALTPSWFVGLEFLALLVLVFNEADSFRVTAKMRFTAAISIALSVVLLVTLEYLGWNPVGASSIVGLQGRYFIPLSLLFCLVICCRRVPLAGRRFAAFWAPLCSLFGLLVLVRRYY